nr:MAG TPA: hypothetical protein [Caudoviricetes sp.]
MAFSCKSTKYLYLPMRIINIVFYYFANILIKTDR